MNSPAREDDDRGKVFLDESDIIHEVTVDEEDLPDVEDEEHSDSENMRVDEEADDSMHIFTGHTGEIYSVTCSPTHPTLVATGGRDDKRGSLGDW